MNAQPEIVPMAPSDNFEPHDWLRLTAALRQHEADLRVLAQRHRLELVSNSRWPEVRLRRRGLFSMGEARVSMLTEPVYPQGNGHHPGWMVRSVRYPRPWIAFARKSAGTSREVARILDADLRRSDAELIAALELAIRQLG